MTITQLIDELQGIYNEHGDVPVFDGKKHDFHARDIRVETCDDWDNSPDGGETPAVGQAVAIGPRF